MSAAELEQYFRQIAREEAEKLWAERAPAESEWLDVPAAMAYTSATEYHVRQIIKKLQAKHSPDVYQPNGPGKKPLLVRRSALNDLLAA